MKLSLRIVLAVGLLGCCLAAQAALIRHLEAPGPLPDVSLVKPLAELPLELNGWQGTEHEVTDPLLLYADEHVRRTYTHADRRGAVSLWVAYSSKGVDRGHHPEVCMAVAGKPEDPSVRQAFPVDGHVAPVQQYRFGRPGGRQWVFYWHYTLPPPDGGQVTQFQRLFQMQRRPLSSVTIEVFSPEQPGDDGENGREFVRLVDAALQAHLGPEAVRGSLRKPVVIDDAEPAVAAGATP